MNIDEDFQQSGNSYPANQPNNETNNITQRKQSFHEPSYMFEGPEAKAPQYRKHEKDSRKTEILEANDLQYSFCIPGLEKIRHSPNYVHKIVWMVAVLLFYGLCVYQLVDRISLYFEAPVVVDVSIEKIKSVEFPAVTICPPFGTDIFFYKFCQRLRQNKRLKSLNFTENNITLEEIWHEFRIKKDAIFALASCTYEESIQLAKHFRNRNKSCGGQKISTKPLLTFWGSCLRLTLTTNLTYLGASTYLQFRVQSAVKSLPDHPCLSESNLKQQETEIVFIPHARDTIPSIELARHNFKVKKGAKASIRFQMQRFTYLNTKKSPCEDKTTADKCKNSCLKNLLKATVPCRLPYMQNSSLKSCPSFKAAERAQIAVDTVYLQFDNCDCSRPCYEMVTNFISDYHSFKRNSSVFTIIYPNNAVEVITEKYAYTFPALLSDIGGSLGFCLGVCMFSMVELILCTTQLTTNFLYERYITHIGRSPVVRLTKQCNN